jgi:hypothetical protein
MMIDVDWRQPFIDYLRKQKVPSDKNLPSSSSTVPSPTPRQRQALQAGCIFRSTHEVCSQTRRQGHLGGDPQRHLRQPRVLPYAGQQGFSMSFLLAHSSGQRRRTSQKVPRVPILR